MCEELQLRDRARRPSGTPPPGSVLPGGEPGGPGQGQPGARQAGQGRGRRPEHLGAALPGQPLCSRRGLRRALPPAAAVHRGLGGGGQGEQLPRE